MTQPAAPKPKSIFRRLADAWREVVETASRLAGIGFIALLVAGAGGILIAMPAGLDLVTTVEDEGLRSPWIATLSAAIAFFGVQAWFWSRMVVVWNYGLERTRWEPRWLLVWAPRVVGLAPLVLLLWAMWAAPAADKTASIAIVVVAALLLGFLIKREDVTRALIAGSARLTRLHQADPTAFRRHWMIFGVVVAVAAWVAMTVWPVTVSQHLGPTATVYLALSGIVPIVVLLMHWGRRARLPIASALLVLAALFTLEPWTWADNHLVGRRAPFGRLNAPIDGKVDLAPEYAAWAAQAPRVGPVQPLVFVASEGGASRAAYWTAAVLAGLQDRSSGQFSRSVFSVTSVSGGSVGAVGFIASLTGRPPAGDEYWRAIEPFVGADFLSPALGGMLFPDLTQRILPVALLPDRSETMERAWEAAWRASCAGAGARCAGDQDRFARPFLSLWRPDGVWRPALLIEGASEEAGSRILTTNLSFLATRSFTDAGDFHTDEGRDVPVSTAILNGARYPWISPAGTLVDQHGVEAGHIVDGGYFDASGAETTRELAQALARARGDGGQLLSDVGQPLIFLMIGNCASQGPQDATLSAPAESTHPAPHTKRLLADVLAPLAGLYSARDGHQAHLTTALIADIAGMQPREGVCQQAIIKGWFAGHPAYYVPIKLCPDGGYAVPLDWVMSRRAKAAMLKATIQDKTEGCLAARNMGWLVNYLRTGQEDIPPRPRPPGMAAAP